VSPILVNCEWAILSEGKRVASPGQLVSKVSELLGISEATIVQHDRNLVVAGLRSKSGRGPSAARMTARDAAHLLVAVLGSHHVKDSVQSVRGYRETRLSKYLSIGYQDSSIAALTSLPPEHSFVDAVEALVAAAADGSLGRAIYDAIDEIQGEKIGFPPIIKISVQSPHQVGDISLGGGETGIARPGLSGYGRYALLDPWSKHESLEIPAEELEAWRKKAEEYHIATDLTQVRQISAKTILAVGELLRS
jgi:hypothetical protein